MSHEQSITFDQDGKHYNIPTVVGGKKLEDRAAIDAHFAGHNPAFGVYPSASEAKFAAINRSRGGHMEELVRQLMQDEPVPDLTKPVSPPQPPYRY